MKRSLVNNSFKNARITNLKLRLSRRVSRRMALVVVMTVAIVTLTVASSASSGPGASYLDGLVGSKGNTISAKKTGAAALQSALGAALLSMQQADAAQQINAQDGPVPLPHPLIVTDKPDYKPDETATIVGDGFQPNEPVTLQVKHSDGTAEGGEGHEPWTVTADENGHVSTTWHVNSDDSLGSTFLLTADGASGTHAEYHFTDAGTTTIGAKVALMAVDYSTTVYDTRNKILATGLVTQVDLIPLGGSGLTLPTLTQLEQYDAVMIWVYGGYLPNLNDLGNLLADYVDTGGSVVVSQWYTCYVAGRFDTGGYLPVTKSCGASGPNNPLVGDELSHPILQDVSTVDAGYTSDFSLTQGATQIAHFSRRFGGTSVPGVITKQSGTGHVTVINSQPAWMSGDGVGRLLANALNWAAKTRSNSAPTANSKTVTTDEDTAVVITLGASDAEGDSLTYTVGSPAHGTLTGTAPNLTYTPAENYNGPDSFTFKVNDGSLDSNVATVTINVVAVNDPPQLSGVPLSATIPELSPYTFTAAATDVDSPANSLAFSLSSSAPAGATINPTTGAFSWTPTEAQGPGNYSFNVIVTDNQGATGSQSINLSVTEVNQAPALDPIGPRAVDELTPLSFTAHAADGDNPSNRLTYSLENGATGAVPSGASINPATGAFSWTPTEAQGPNTYKFTVKVTDNGAGNLSAREEIIVTVNEVNAAPTLAAVGNKTVDEQTALSFNAVGGDTDDPANTLTYSLADGTTAESGVSLAVPAGASINPTTGAFSWTPAEAQGPGKYRFIVKVTDNGTPSRSGQEEITVTVNEVNTAPALNAIPGPKTVDEETPLTFTARATDADLPANTLAYSLIPAAAGGTLPDGAAIDATTGVFTWTPTEAQGPGSYSFKVKVSDGTGQTGLTDEKLVTVNVNEVNKRPALPAIGNATPFWGQSVAFTPTATDGDLPANTLSYALTSSNQGGVPGNVSFNAATGAFSWTPTALQAGATYNFTITVNDNTGANNATDSKSFSVTVGKHPTTLTYGGALAGQYSDPAALSATLLDTVTNTAVAGAPITFQLGTQNAGAPSGLGTTLILTQDPAPSYNVVSSFAGDGAYVASGDTDAFDITQEDARAYYTGALYAATSSTSSGSATVTLAATIRDITAETADPAFDANAGDIRNATVKFVNRDANNAVLCTAGIGLVNLSDTKVGTVTCDWAANIGSAESDQFTVGIVVSGFYRRDASTENTVVTVSKPIAGLVTGGGYLVLSSPGGQRAGDVGSKSNFGFNIRNDPKTGPKGKINAIVRRRESDGIVHVYQIKGNAMSSLAQDLSKTTNHPYPTAVFNGKANIQDITNPLAPISIDGGASLQVVMTDKGEPGSADMIAITLWDKAGGLWFSSNWNGTKTSEQVLGGGNLQIR